MTPEQPARVTCPCCGSTNVVAAHWLHDYAVHQQRECVDCGCDWCESKRRSGSAGQWLPISEAPRNTPILVTDGTVMVVLERGACGSDSNWLNPVGFSGHEWDWDFQWKDLTHWQPLPPPPGAREGKFDEDAP